MKFVTWVLTLLSVGLLAWVGFSYLDIIAHNLSVAPQYADWNIFTVLRW